MLQSSEHLISSAQSRVHQKLPVLSRLERTWQPLLVRSQQRQTSLEEIQSPMELERSKWPGEQVQELANVSAVSNSPQAPRWWLPARIIWAAAAWSGWTWWQKWYPVPSIWHSVLGICYLAPCAWLILIIPGGGAVYPSNHLKNCVLHRLVPAHWVPIVQKHL